MVEPLRAFNFEVFAPQLGQARTFIATIRVPLTKQEDATKILHYLRSAEIKHDLMNGWAAEKAPNYGMEIVGGPRPEHFDEKDRTSKVLAYAQDFRFTKGF